jgi:lipopolysaccharide biosynthesis protein
VARAEPLFGDHYQPHLPRDLGFYDLRLPEATSAQADLAQRYGISAFCYYHYWFEGRTLLETPFQQTLKSKEPDFPFVLCWANENWTRVWTGGTRDVLMLQTYSPEDDRRHLRHLSEAFSDRRYLRIDGKPVFLVYRPSALPSAAETAERWRVEAARLGIGELYLCAVHSNTTVRQDPSAIGFDAAVQFQPDFGDLGPRLAHGWARRAARKYFRPASPHRLHRLHSYQEIADRHLAASLPDYKRFPCVTPGFDNSPRRRAGGAAVLVGSNPERYGQWLGEVLRTFAPYSDEEDLVFVNAWNEWAEGNHLEPDERWGHGYLEAHSRALEKYNLHS